MSVFTIFYVNHEITTICRNSGQETYTPEPPKELIEKYRNLDSHYYTVDYVELEDGTWRIVEAGDGEVSGLSDNQDYEVYFRTLYQCFK
ncbi:MAG: ATP-grasp domain-containing protein [Eubacterium sp.]|nr:ATP-grasp domain-containing protein [Eubacterium sp.]